MKISKDGYRSWKVKFTCLVHKLHHERKCKVENRLSLYLCSKTVHRFDFCSDELDEAGIDFVKKCIQIIERRGLNEQGLYRIVGMQSKVNSLVATHFGKKNELSQVFFFKFSF